MLDQTSGTSATESVAANTGTVASTATWQAGGPLGRYIELAGGYVTASALSFSGEWSACAWVRTTNAENQIVGMWGIGGDAQKWILGITDTGIEAFVYNSGYSGFGKAVTLEDWCWKLVGVSARSGTSTLYVDGQPVATAAAVLALSGSTVVNIGRKATGSVDKRLYGGVAGVAVWSKALTGAQHQAIFDAAPWECRRAGFRNLGLTRGARSVT